MSELIRTLPSALPDILAAAGLILLGTAFCRKRARYRREEYRLREAIRSLRDGTENEERTESAEAAADHTGKGEV